MNRAEGTRVTKDFRSIEREYAKESKRIYDSAEEKLTNDMEAWTEERLKKNPPPKKDEG